MTDRHCLHTRRARPSSRCTANRTTLPHFGQTNMTLAWSSGASNWITPGFIVRPPVWIWRWCFLRRLAPCTTRRPSLGSVRSTSPRMPLSRPLMTSTVSPFLIFTSALRRAGASQYFRRQRGDLGEPLVAQLARHRAEDARAPGVDPVGVQDDGGVVVEPDVRTVLAPVLLGRPDDDRFDHVALVHRPVRRRRLDRRHDHVADRARPAPGSAHNMDHQQLAAAGVVGDFEPRLVLDHPAALLRAIVASRGVPCGIPKDTGTDVRSAITPRPSSMDLVVGRRVPSGMLSAIIRSPRPS